MPIQTSVFTCVNWNIHRARGHDGVVDPDRIARVLQHEVWRPDVEALVLQEADEDAPPHRGLLDIARIEAATGLRHVQSGVVHRWGRDCHGFLGIVLFLHPDARIESIDLVDLPGYIHRGCVVVDFHRGGRPLRLIGVHLSLSQALRIVQMRTIGQHVLRRDDRPTILCGDLNEWRPWGGLALSRRVTGVGFVSGAVQRTFPARWPVLPLDRVLVTPPARVRRTEVLDGDGIRIASDHRPVRAEVMVPD